MRLTPFVWFLMLAPACLGQKTIALSDGAAPGSEKAFFSTTWNTQVVTNVVNPSLTVFAPEPGTANGTGIVICPGGGFYALSINSEGIDVAKWLAARGVTAFVLKYRLVPTAEDGTKEFMAAMGKPEKMKSDTENVIPMAFADGLAAMTYVRKHAADYGLATNRIGIIGFSAGGTVTAAVAFQYTPESRPDFVAPIYVFMGAVKEAPVPADAPPAFLVAATDDQLGLAPDSVKFYSKWIAARKPAELHMYAKGGHGFGMREQNLPTDHWIDRFGEWLTLQGFMKK